MKALSLGFCLFLCVSCQSLSELRSVKEIEQLSHTIEHQNHDVVKVIDGVHHSVMAIDHDARKIKQLLNDLEKTIDQIWGNKKRALPSNKRYVKYSNNYQARAIVDFTKGEVIVETIAKESATKKLAQAVFETLLTTDDPTKTDIFSSASPNTKGEPFLYPQVKDHDNQLVRYPWRARRYADHLVNTALKTVKQNNRTYHSVSFNLVKDHQHLRHLKYSEYVLSAAKKYHISPALIYAVIETESAFNPYAVSRSNAYGLMQIIPATAGRDVYRIEKGIDAMPTKSLLMEPMHNIDIGTAYLKILNTRYLVGVKINKSREYTVISAYNGGAGNVFKTYHSNKTTAVNKINALSAEAVYHSLRYQHPRAESRRYLEKVTLAKQKYL